MVNFNLKKINKYNGFNIIDIELTDDIGTTYEGKAYETNVLDFDVKVKDRVCGLIVSDILRTENGGLAVRLHGRY